MLCRRRLPVSVLCAIAPLTLALHAQAAPQIRTQVAQKGDIVLLGNTLGYECAAGTPAPIVGEVAAGACSQGNTTGDSAPDLYWRADAPAVGQAQATQAFTHADARSTAVLTLTPGATITHAYLYWASVRVAGADLTATIERPGVASLAVQALDSNMAANSSYQSMAEVTDFVREHGPGAFRVSGVEGPPLVNVSDTNNFAGWWMAVFYTHPSEPLRSLTLYDGLDTVTSVSPQNVSLGGFLVPQHSYEGHLGVIAFEGDHSGSGDQLFFNNTALFNQHNPVDNVFNSTRTHLGNPVSTVGDLPQLTGTAQSLAGVDIDVFDVTTKLTPGQTSAAISATSNGDVYHLAGFVVSLNTFVPDLSSAHKTVTDLNGDGVVAGDVLEYEISVQNNGNDAAIDTILRDQLPSSVSFVPNSISIVEGPNLGAKTDAVGDDQAEYAAMTHTLTVRLGTGATASTGGQLAIGQRTRVRFRVTVNAGAQGSISNQAELTAAGLLGGPNQTTLTDADPATSHAEPTVVLIDACDASAPCAAPTPACDTSAHPYQCVECVADLHCPGLRPTCDTATNTCVCVASGEEICDGRDNNCDGQIDEGFAEVCVGCSDDSDCGGADSGRICHDTNQLCIDGCRGAQGNGCPSGEVCSSSDPSMGQCTAAPSSSSGSSGSSSSSGGIPSGSSSGGGDGGSSGGGEPALEDFLEGGACSAGAQSGSWPTWLLLGALGTLAVANRRRSK